MYTKLDVFCGFFFVKTKVKEEAGASVAYCLVELFVVATSKIMRCHYSTVCVREGQALCSFCKEKSNFPCFPVFPTLFLPFSKQKKKKKVLPNSSCKLFLGDFSYFNLTHPYLWTRNHIKYLPPGPFCGSISTLNYLQVMWFFFIGGFGSHWFNQFILSRSTIPSMSFESASSLPNFLVFLWKTHVFIGDIKLSFANQSQFYAIPWSIRKWALLFLLCFADFGHATLGSHYNIYTSGW